MSIRNTERQIKVCTWLQEISSCSCLTVLPGPTWVLLSKTYKPLFAPLYINVKFTNVDTYWTLLPKYILPQKNNPSTVPKGARVNDVKN